MNGEVTWKVDDLSTQLEELEPALRSHLLRRHRAGHRFRKVLGEPPVDPFREPVEELVRETQRLADLPDRHPRLEGDHIADHPRPLPAVLVVDVLDHLLAVLGREIDVDVRHARHVLVQEALEQQVVRDGIDPGDAEHVGDDRVGRRAAALAGHSVLAREAHEIPVDEKELGEACLLDHLQLALQPARDLDRDGPVALAHPLETQLVQE